MSDTLKQLFSNDKADEIISAIESIGGVNAIEYVKSVGLCVLDALEYVSWNASNAEEKLATLREAIYNPPSDVLPAGYTKHDYIYKYRGTVSNFDPVIKIKQYPRIYEKGIDISFGFNSSITSGGGAILGSRLRSAQITNNAQSFAFYQNGSKAWMHLYGSDRMINGVKSGKNIIKFRPASDGATITLNNETPLEVTGSYGSVLSFPGLTVSANPVYYTDQSQTDNPSVNSGTNIGEIKIYDGNTMIGHYIPCVRIADSVIGYFDVVEKVFYTSTNPSYATEGDSNCIYATGEW